MSGIPNYLPGNPKVERRSVLMTRVEEHGPTDISQRLKGISWDWPKGSAQRKAIDADLKWLKSNYFR